MLYRRLLLRAASSTTALSFVVLDQHRPRQYSHAPQRATSADEPSERVASFGVIADIQYCDIEDATNFSGTEFRRYRGSLASAREAAEAFRESRVDFVAQLGDLIDGQNGGTYGAGLREFGDRPQSSVALARVLDVLDACGAPCYHCVGNHELMNFDAAKLSADGTCEPLRAAAGPAARALNEASRHVASVDGRLYHAFDVGETWTMIVLNPYEVSLMQPKETPGYATAAALLRRENPNNVVDAPSGTVDFFRGLDGPAMRFVPFNGGVGDAQLRWLADRLADARGAKRRVAVLTHLPIHPDSASWRNVPYDTPELLALLESYRDVVVAVFAGHCHRGGYAHAADIHHITVPATLTHEVSYGVVDVYEDRLVLRGSGALPSLVCQ